MPPGLSIELDLTGRTTTVVGLGSVGRRKARALLDAAAQVVAVDPRPQAELALDPILQAALSSGRLTLRTEPYHARHLERACLAIAAAPPSVNRHVVGDAKARGIWVVSATEPVLGTARLPAVWRRGSLTLSVTTGGASPALAGLLRDRAAAALGEAAAGLATVFEALRPEVAARLADRPEARRRLLRDWGNPTWLALYEAGGPEAVREAVGHAIAVAAGAVLDASPCEKNFPNP